jgi:lipoprotein
MKKLLAAALCLIALVGCGKPDLNVDLKLGSYYFNNEVENSYMPSIVLKDNNRFDIIYKGYYDGNLTGTYTIEENNLLLTTDVNAGRESTTYTFEIKDDNLVYRFISAPLYKRADNGTGYGGEISDCTEFTYTDETDTATTVSQQ